MDDALGEGFEGFGSQYHEVPIESPHDEYTFCHEFAEACRYSQAVFAVYAVSVLTQKHMLAYSFLSKIAGVTGPPTFTHFITQLPTVYANVLKKSRIFNPNLRTNLLLQGFSN